MNQKGILKIGLAGNPNSGKSSLFNYLTGLKQNVANFPGVTVDKKTGSYTSNQGVSVELIDLPGTYSVFPNSIEEKITVDILLNEDNSAHPDLIIYVADITQLDRQLLFCSQILDLGIPVIFVMNMVDLTSDVHINKSKTAIKELLGLDPVNISVRSNFNLDGLKKHIDDSLDQKVLNNAEPFYKIPETTIPLLTELSAITKIPHLYKNKLIAHHYSWITGVSTEQKNKIKILVDEHGFHDIKSQVEETMTRYGKLDKVLHFAKIDTSKSDSNQSLTDKIDAWVTHKYLGPVMFFVIMLFIFQSIYAWAVYPMDKIEEGFGALGTWIASSLPDTMLADILVNGLLPGLSGVMVFIPQIAILFLLISILEESGYMSRVVYMFDGLLQKFGMNGRSIVSLISSGACAIPAIMSTRTISNPKERLITILVSPLISCSARLPVYAVLIGFVVPSQTVMGVLNLQGIAFMGLYLLGIVGALLSGWVFSKIIKSEGPSFLMIELPNYKPPIWKNVVINVKEKVFSFIKEAGQVIVFISLLLWLLASYGPGQNMQIAEQDAVSFSNSLDLPDEEMENIKASYKLEASYIGIAGKWIEPAISPLGFDWKIGIALITSFAAREVFVGTMATIYSLGSTNDEKTIRQKMSSEVRAGTQQKTYDMPTSFALLIFYVFALQCMSTLAVTKKETNTWKWPIVQFLFMGGLAYLGAFIVYQTLS